MRVRRTIVFVAVLSAALAASFAGAAAAQTAARAPARPNVLFIVVDDLNDWVGHLGGNPQSSTPNLDRLARRGVRFTHAYTAVPLCNPSRTAVLSGMRPSTTGVYDNLTDWRPIVPEPKMLTAQFRSAGYWVAGAGKVHHYLREGDWDELVKSSDGFERWVGDSLHVDTVNDVPDEAMADHRNVSWLIRQLERKHDRPFFLAAGLSKPHLPWNVPRHYYERFPLDGIELPPFLDNDLADLPATGVAMARSGRSDDVEGAVAESDHEAIVRTGRWKAAIRGYLASVAFMDAQVGRLIDALDRSAYRDDTIVVLWSDHGWHLGEKRHWRKMTLWEESTRVPFVWIVPGVTTADTVCDRPVDLMSIYPTLMDLAGLTVPDHVQGASVRALLADPSASWREPALTTYLFGNHAVRDQRWRYIRYHDGGEELYDEENDPHEWRNVADRSEHASIKAELAKSVPRVDAAPAPRTRDRSSELQ